MVFVDGVYVTGVAEPPVFRHLPAPGTAELQALFLRIAERMGRLLETRDLIEREARTAVPLLR